jgi:hypothetical protein
MTMLQINVTHLVDGEPSDLQQYSDSINNSGLSNIGEFTWNNARRAARKASLVKSEDQDTLRDWIYELGGWTGDEVDAMSDVDTNALLLQFIAGDIQEMHAHDDYEDYVSAQQEGTTSSHLWRADDGQWFFDVSN